MEVFYLSSCLVYVCALGNSRVWFMLSGRTDVEETEPTSCAAEGWEDIGKGATLGEHTNAKSFYFYFLADWGRL